jgi:tRNA threonylcarbamoyladenosine biosynthesis protein TsaB
MAFILNIETATKNCSVSIAENGKTISLQEIALESFSHAEKLHVFIEEILKKVNLKPNQLNAIAVSAGPGSYTGLRIGVSSAKGLSYALDVPLISVDTLTLLAKQINIENGTIISMIDARRQEVYSAFFDKNHNKTRETLAEIIDETYLNDQNDIFHLIGDGAMKFENILPIAKFKFYPHIQYPSANEMSEISFNKYQNQQFEDVAYFEPFYLKDFVLVK